MVDLEDFTEGMITEINNLLYDQDPCNTCCKENECFDEYDWEAAVIVDKVLQNLWEIKPVARDQLIVDIAEDVIRTRFETPRFVMPFESASKIRTIYRQYMETTTYR